MHIALICDELPPGPHGGIGSVTADLAAGLAGAGHRVTIFVAETVGRHWSLNGTGTSDANPRVVSLYLTSPRWMRWRPGAYWKRWTLLKALKAAHARTPFDLVECMDNGGLLPFGGPRGVPTVVRLHGASFFIDAQLGMNTTDPLTHWFEKRTLKCADRLVGVSDYIGKAESALAGLDRAADRTIYNAVDVDLFSPGPEGGREDGLIVFANSIHPLKGIIELCRAMNIVGKEFPNARLVVMGKDITVGASGRPLSVDVAEEIEPALRDRVVFTGGKPRAEVAAWLRKAHLCCYPSKIESFGLGPVEAMAVGKPVIFSGRGSGPEIMEDGVSGLLCDPESPGDIAEKIGTILRNPALAARLGKAARERVLARFNRAEWIPKNIAFYEKTATSLAPAL